MFEVEFDVSESTFPSPEAMLFWSLAVISFASIIPDDPDNESAGGKLDCIAATSFIQRLSACFFFHNSLKLMQASLHTLNIKTELILKLKVFMSTRQDPPVHNYRLLALNYLSYLIVRKQVRFAEISP